MLDLKQLLLANLSGGMRPWAARQRLKNEQTFENTV